MDGQGGGYTAGVGSIFEGQPANSGIAYLAGYWGGSILNQRLVDGNVFSPALIWHTYRVEATRDTITLKVDGAVLATVSDNRYLAGGQVGLWCNGSQIEVRSFQVSL